MFIEQPGGLPPDPDPETMAHRELQARSRGAKDGTCMTARRAEQVARAQVMARHLHVIVQASTTVKKESQCKRKSRTPKRCCGTAMAICGFDLFSFLSVFSPGNFSRVFLLCVSI